MSHCCAIILALFNVKKNNNIDFIVDFDKDNELIREISREKL